MSAPGKIHAFLVGSCGGLPEICAALSNHEEVELLGSTGDDLETLEGWDVDVVLYATNGPAVPRDALDGIRARTDAPVILLASASTPGVLEEALHLDVADALLLPQPPESVLYAIRRVTGRKDVAAAAEGRVVTVFSPKGGSGKTLTATNLAAAAAAEHGLRTLLLDFDLQFGDCAVALGLEPAKTVYDLVSAPGEIDPDKLDGYVVTHSSGLDLLAAPANPEEGDLVPQARLESVLEVARDAYQLVVVDTPPFLHGPTLVALDHADELLLTATLDVPTLKNVRQSLDTLELISFPGERISLVLNRSTAQAGIKRREVEAALDVGIRFVIPDDPTAQLAVNRGNVPVLAEPRSEFAQAIRELTAAVLRSPARTPTGARS